MRAKPTECMAWSIRIPVFRNRIILKQLGLAIGIPFGLLIFILCVVTGRERSVWYALALVGVLFLLTYLFILLVYGGKYDVEFSLDNKGICCRTQMKQARKNKIINGITIVLGFFTGRFAAAGAGMMADARQTVTIQWRNIRKVKYCPKQHSILIKGRFTENIALFCTLENYDTVRDCIRSKVKI